MKPKSKSAVTVLGRPGKPLLIAALLALAAPAPARSEVVMSNPILRPDGQMEFTLAGGAGPKWVEVSNNLSAWTRIASATGAETRVAFRGPAGARAQFFRARLAGAPGSEFGAEAVVVRSSAVTLDWSPPAGATATRIYLAPEPGLLATAGRARRLLATLDGDVARYAVQSLAAGVDAFFRIESDTPEGTKSAVVHARTAGGPRATLDTRLREVQGYGPNILMVTLADGPTGTLKDGWSVRRGDGTAVPVRAVHRNSIPVSAPDYPLGLDGVGSLKVQVDHRIFLELGEDIGSSELLDIRGPEGLEFTLPFSDRYLETPVIQLNQVGYNPRARKRWAYVSGWMGDGGPLALATFPVRAEVLLEPGEETEPRSTRVAEFAVAPRKAMDVLAGTEVKEIDLAGLPVSETARYRIRLPGVGVSWRTEVSERAAFKAYYVMARGLFHNRWGGDLRPDLTEWSRPADHEFVFTAEWPEWSGKPGGAFPFEFDTPQTGRRRLQGGHHDAGDFDQRPFHAAVPQMLMRAYEVAPEAFVDGQLHLPESGNGIPDLLDEALWNIAAWEQLQEDDGGVRLGVESWRHPANQGILAHLDDLPYWTFARDPNHTARCAGLFAQAARLVRPFNQARSEQLLERARRAWLYATRHDARAVMRLYPAGELFRLTSEPVFADAFESVWRSLGSADWESFQSVGSRTQDTSVFMEYHIADADHLCAYLGSFPAGAERAAYLRDAIRQRGIQAAGLLENEDFDAFRNTRPRGYSLGWGQALAQGRGLTMAYAALQIGETPAADRQEILDGASLGADYILGGNPLGLVFVTGLGTRHVEEPLHLDSLAYIKMGKGPMPGIPVYGPTGEYDGVGYVATTMAAFHPVLAPATGGETLAEPASVGHPFFRRYADVRLWVRANEFSVMEMQGPHVQLFAVLMMGTRGAMPPESYRPGGAGHRSPLP